MKRLIICFLIFILAVFVFIFALNNSKNDAFVKPEFDKNAVDGVKNEENDECLSSLSFNDNYSVIICSNPCLEDDKLYIMLSSIESNNVNMKVRVFKNDKVVGESGLIKPNQYLDYVNVSDIKVGDKIKVKIMGYDEDYHSAGALNLNFILSN